MIASNVENIPEPIQTGVTRFLLKALVGDDEIAVIPSVVSTESVVNTVIPSNTPAPPLVSTPTFDNTLLNLPLSQVQFVTAVVTVGGVDVSACLVNSLSVNWPDEGGGTCDFALRSENPFTAIPTTGIDIEDLVIVTGSLIDSTGTSFSAIIFKGRVVQTTYNPDTDTLDVECQDFSRDVSRETDKIDQEILQVDPVITETRTAQADKIVTSRAMNLDTENPVLGIWEENDTVRKTNIIEQVDFIFTDTRTFQVLGPLGVIVAGRNYLIRYAVPLSAFIVPVRTKSQIVNDIAQISNITSLKNDRIGKVEDEIVRVNIVANQEFPLDIIRKVVIPQTWKVEYDQAGDLIIRREILKIAANADFTFNEDVILEDSLTITKQTDSVVNEQRVSGVVKRLGRS